MKIENLEVEQTLEKVKKQIEEEKNGSSGNCVGTLMEEEQA